jgi:hypothetical protein
LWPEHAWQKKPAPQPPFAQTRSVYEPDWHWHWQNAGGAATL